ncbi:AraC family transcriptional regulator [Thermomonospora cellulosilytica]|uniref:AraC-like DNA-binding protein n=1 Tax=Thermomonospora cellulosilytica TaxID=1411118 RepID=A0A7W3R994_9ACTN|nr:AraC family transcriptional regulator [Thermomonospora cellulosilytica]MBA9004125.1 AraC-like DNA-binding protein [Thermomonospora cellulosilytica]
MDALAGLLDGPRARGAFLLRAVLDAPWSMRVQDRAPLTLVALLRGHAWVRPDGGEPVRGDAGDIAVIRGPDPYTVADDPDRRPDIVIHPNGRCTALDGRELFQEMSLGVRSWGTGPDGAHQMLVGTYQMEGEVSRRLLEALPPLLMIPAETAGTPLVGLLGAEMAVDRPGQAVVLDRLLDLLLITSLRAWFDRERDAAPAWYRAHADPVVGRALRLIHDQPAHPWTVASLADRVGVSRAALARRFTALVGEPPMTYLTGWRLALAADLLREPDATVDKVARRVGYSTPFALSSAFKRVRGVSPREFRATAGAAG